MGALENELFPNAVVVTPVLWSHTSMGGAQPERETGTAVSCSIRFRFAERMEAHGGVELIQVVRFGFGDVPPAMVVDTVLIWKVDLDDASLDRTFTTVSMPQPSSLNTVWFVDAQEVTGS